MARAQSGTKPKSTNPKQLMIVAALLAVLITVGVVQFGGLLGGGGAPAAKPTPSRNASNTATNSPSQTASASSTGVQLPPLPPRDPFRPSIQTAQLSQPESESNKVVRSAPAPRREVAEKSAPRREITGTPPPLPPMTLPSGGQIGLQPADPPPPAEPEPPRYTITGIVLGPNSVAILADGEGRRRFVKQGDLLEEGWRVARIERGKVTLRKGKQQLTVRVGESSAPNGGNQP